MAIGDCGVEGVFPTFVARLEDIYDAAETSVDLAPFTETYEAMDRNTQKNLNDEMVFNKKGKRAHEELSEQLREQIAGLPKPRKKGKKKRSKPESDDED